MDVGSRSVLIVDDEASAREVTRDLLIPEGYRLFVASGGADALAMLDAVQPDVIVSDLMMPGIDGIALCQALRQQPHTRATPIIVVTALDSRADMLRALDAGANDFLTKPVHGIELRARVRSMMHVANEHRLLEQILRLRSDLTYMALHDMRNPLQAIGLSNDVVARLVTDTRAVMAVQRIRSGAVRLQKLIDDILIAARSQSGHLTLDRSMVRLSEIIGTVEEDVRPITEHAQVRLHVTAIPDVDLHVDRSLFRRCLENLLTNAVKFSPRSAAIEITASAENSVATIDVADEGPGVAEADRETIFEPFRIGETQRGVPQLGLGLAFCRMVVDGHGGTIAALPRDPQGSVFRITIACRGAEAAT